MQCCISHLSERDTQLRNYNVKIHLRMEATDLVTYLTEILRKSNCPRYIDSTEQDTLCINIYLADHSYIYPKVTYFAKNWTLAPVVHCGGIKSCE
jgi:hypothetical protein